MGTTRREFLKGLGFAAALTAMPGCSATILSTPAKKRGLVVFPSFNGGIVRFYDWDKRKIVGEVQTPLKLSHSALQIDQNPDKILIFENSGLNCVLVDKRSMKIDKVANASTGNNFYGHGSISPSGQLLLCTEFPAKNSSYERGAVSIRNPLTLQQLGQMESFGVHPHDICFLTENIVAITNHGDEEMGADSNISFISFPDGKLIHKFEVPLSRGHFGHLLPIRKDMVFASFVKTTLARTEKVRNLQKLVAAGGKDGQIAAKKLRDALVYHPAPMFLASVSGSIAEAWDPIHSEDFKNNFSICRIPGRNEFHASANGASDAVVIWRNSSVFKILHFPGMYPSAVCASEDGSELMIGSSNGQIRFLNTENFSEISSAEMILKDGPVHITRLI